jgi:integrase
VGRALGAGRLVATRRPDGSRAWTLDYRGSDGRRHREQLGTDKALAERRRNEVMRQRDLSASGLGQVEGQSRPLRELVEPYLADLAMRACPKQVLNVRSRLMRVLRSLRATRVRDLQVVELMRYRAERVKAGRSNRTANADPAALSAMLTWAVRAQLIAANPLSGLRRLPQGEQHQKRVRRALSDEEIERFLDAAAEDDREQADYRAAATTIAHGSKGAKYDDKRRLPRVPQCALWRALIDTGARWSEATRTEWSDLDVQQKTLRLRAVTTKSGRSRQIPLSGDLVAELLALRVVHQRARERLVQPSDRIFLTPDAEDWGRDTKNAMRLFRRVLCRAEIAKENSAGVLDIHALRHACASRMARHGVKLVVAQRILGHSDPSLTARVYTHLGTEDLREAVELVPPTLPRAKPRLATPGEENQGLDQDQQRARA